jgi:hypothetical protein
MQTGFAIPRKKQLNSVVRLKQKQAIIVCIDFFRKKKTAK